MMPVTIGKCPNVKRSRAIRPRCAARVLEHVLGDPGNEREVHPPQHAGDRGRGDEPMKTSSGQTDSGGRGADRHQCLPERDDDEQRVTLGEVHGVDHPLARSPRIALTTLTRAATIHSAPGRHRG